MSTLVAVYLLIGAVIGAGAFAWVTTRVGDTPDRRTYWRVTVRITIPCVLLWPGVVGVGLLGMTPLRGPLERWVRDGEITSIREDDR